LGIVHRDIKPSNVLLAWSGRPMLLDFNLSWGIDQEGDRIGGTVAYMAPERITALLAAEPPVEEGLDPRPDIFSLGVVLYELLTGRLPVQPMDAEGSDEASLRKWLAARSQPIAPPSQLNRDVDAAIDRIVLRALAVEPGERFATAAELVSELAAYLGPRQRAARWTRRHRRRLLLSTAAATLVLVVGGAYWATRPPYHEVQYQEGLRFHDAGDFLGAIQAYDKALADEPSLAKAHAARGQSYYQEGLRLYDVGDHSGAIEAFTHSLADEPQSVNALFARGQSYYWSGDYPSAQKDYAAAAAIEDRAIFSFCAACCALSDASAANYLATALKLGHDEAEVYCNLGVYYSNRNPRTAVDSFRGAIAKNDRLRVAYVELANALFNELSSNEAALGEALKCAEKAIELGARSKRLYLLATRLHLKAGASDPQSRQRAEECCRQWLAYGGDPELSKNDRLLGPLIEKFKGLESGPTLAPSADQDDLRRGVLPPRTADLSRLP
jgi:tetratricopeptide (TPR) repeat protein